MHVLWLIITNTRALAYGYFWFTIGKKAKQNHASFTSECLPKKTRFAASLSVVFPTFDCSAIYWTKKNIFDFFRTTLSMVFEEIKNRKRVRKLYFKFIFEKFLKKKAIKQTKTPWENEVYCLNAFGIREHFTILGNSIGAERPQSL